jgi:hypothetical protein
VFCREERIVSTPDGAISRCRCGVYHVQINAVTLHLTEAQFDSAARLFKLALGASAGHRAGAGPGDVQQHMRRLGRTPE